MVTLIRMLINSMLVCRLRTIGSALAAVMLLLLVACHPYEFEQSCYRWRFEEGQSCYPCLDSVRLYLKPQIPCGTLQLEIVRDHCGCRMYLSTLCHVFCDASDVDEVAVEVEIEGHKRFYGGYIFEGGQRLWLCDEALEDITTALWDDQCVSLRVGMHKARLTSACFQKGFTAMDTWMQRARNRQQEID